jgi:hypothetical protein
VLILPQHLLFVDHLQRKLNTFVFN